MALGPSHLGPPIDALPHLAPERGAFVDLLASLDRAAWRAPTACPGWSVFDVAAHVLGDDLGRLARGRDATSGVAHAPGKPLARFIDRLNDEWVRAAARLSPRLVTDLLAWSGAEVAAAWAAADRWALGEPVSWAGPGPAPVWLDLARDFSEYWAHHQQVREALGLGVGGPVEWTATVLDTYLRALPHTLRAVGAAEGDAVVVEVTGPAGGRWTARRGPAGWVVDRGGTDASTAHVRLDADTTWRLCTRGITPDAAAARAEVRGDGALARAALDIVAIIC